jgi:hypothetical protein
MALFIFKIIVFIIILNIFMQLSFEEFEELRQLITSKGKKPRFKKATVFIYNLKFRTRMLKVKDTQTPFTIEWPAPIDAKGNPAEVQDNAYAVSSTDETVATVAQDATNPRLVTVTPTGKLGPVSVKISADADLGTGVINISDQLDIEVDAGQAVGFAAPTVSGVAA